MVTSPSLVQGGVLMECEVMSQTSRRSVPSVRFSRESHAVHPLFPQMAVKVLRVAGGGCPPPGWVGGRVQRLMTCPMVPGVHYDGA